MGTDRLRGATEGETVRGRIGRSAWRKRGRTWRPYRAAVPGRTWRPPPRCGDARARTEARPPRGCQLDGQRVARHHLPLRPCPGRGHAWGTPADPAPPLPGRGGAACPAGGAHRAPTDYMRPRADGQPPADWPVASSSSRGPRSPLTRPPPWESHHPACPRWRGGPPYCTLYLHACFAAAPTLLGGARLMYLHGARRPFASGRRAHHLAA